MSETNFEKLKACFKRLKEGTSNQECERLINDYQNYITKLPTFVKIEIMDQLEMDSIINLCDTSKAMKSFCDKDVHFKTYLCDRISRDLRECMDPSRFDILFRIKEAINEPPSYRSGAKVWKNRRDELHRDADLPAYINDNFDQKVWYKNGVIYRRGNKPSIIEDIAKAWTTPDGLIYKVQFRDDIYTYEGNHKLDYDETPLDDEDFLSDETKWDTYEFKGVKKVIAKYDDEDFVETYSLYKQGQLVWIKYPKQNDMIEMYNPDGTKNVRINGDDLRIIKKWDNPKWINFKDFFEILKKEFSPLITTSRFIYGLTEYDLFASVKIYEDNIITSIYFDSTFNYYIPHRKNKKLIKRIKNIFKKYNFTLKEGGIIF